MLRAEALNPAQFHADLDLLFSLVCKGAPAAGLAQLSGGLGGLGVALLPEQRAALETVTKRNTVLERKC